ncbi:DUF3613 domain-containing protein [Comamonas guangdongensis]|uniref:DUF3613 domain-containing protein n=1 Tax=Comamonas guangdongensis TaxID=510515 RepID=A0ABV3ZWQ4_9BURK
MKANHARRINLQAFQALFFVAVGCAVLPQPVRAQAAADAPAPAAAQSAVIQVPAAAQAATPGPGNRVGDATSYLLALQAGGQAASRNAYPVTSDVAQRSYQRYLESFTHKIPASSDALLGPKSGGR